MTKGRRVPASFERLGSGNHAEFGADAFSGLSGNMIYHRYVIRLEV